MFKIRVQDDTKQRMTLALCHISFNTANKKQLLKRITRDSSVKAFVQHSDTWLGLGIARYVEYCLG